MFHILVDRPHIVLYIVLPTDVAERIDRMLAPDLARRSHCDFHEEFSTQNTRAQNEASSPNGGWSNGIISLVWNSGRGSLSSVQRDEELEDRRTGGLD